MLKEVKQDDKLKLILIIVLTTSKDEDDICNSYKCYANAYVTKPTDFDDFDELICSFEDFGLKKPYCLHVKTVKEIRDSVCMSNSHKLLDKAYKCKPTDLESLLKEIEIAIKNSEYSDKVLLRAKTVVTSKLAAYYCK